MSVLDKFERKPLTVLSGLASSVLALLAMLNNIDTLPVLDQIPVVQDYVTESITPMVDVLGSAAASGMFLIGGIAGAVMLYILFTEGWS